MNKWNIVKVKYTKQLDDGTLKRVTEPYLVNSISFTDAEARIYKEIGDAVRGEFIVSNISPTNITDIIADDNGTENWFKVKAVFIIENDFGKFDFCVACHRNTDYTNYIENHRN